VLYSGAILREAYGRTRKDGAVGVDGQTARHMRRISTRILRPCWTALRLALITRHPCGELTSPKREALPNSDAAMLGVELKTGVPAMGRGISNKPLHGWRHQIVMRLKENQFEIPMILLNSDAAPRVLGREGVFEHFIVTLEEG
jgi:hypothetical protein